MPAPAAGATGSNLPTRHKRRNRLGSWHGNGGGERARHAAPRPYAASVASAPRSSAISASTIATNSPISVASNDISTPASR